MNPDPTGTTSKEPVVRENVHLRPFNTLGVEATADYFAAVETAGQLFRLYRENLLEQDLWILGGGSNVLFAGRVHALVLKNEIDFRELLREDEDHVLLKAGGGSDWHGLVTCCVEKGWGGIENLALIPGTAGAAPVQNIGAYGTELSDCFIALEAFDLREGRLRTFSHEECRFGYRDSIFKKDFKNRFFIVSITLRLKKAPHAVRVNYRVLSERLAGKGIDRPGIKDVFEAVVEIRTEKLPDPSDLANAGSFFKNPVVSTAVLKKLQSGFREVPFYPAGEEQVKIPAGWLIEKAGWKGRRVGNVGTYENQALVIVNHGGATGDEIWALAVKICEDVRKKFGIELVPEVNVTGSAVE